MTQESSLLTSSPDASRFLAQSQSKPKAPPVASTADDSPSSPNSSRARLLQPPNMPGPYQQSSRFPFGKSQPAAPPAPLFHSATDDFRDDEGEDHQREFADLWALQRSRRAFRASHITESSEGDDVASSHADGSDGHSAQSDPDLGNERPRGRLLGGAFRGPWRKQRENVKGKQPAAAGIALVPEDAEGDGGESRFSARSGRSKGRDLLDDIQLSQADAESIEDLGADRVSPPYDGFRFKPSPAIKPAPYHDDDDESWSRQENDAERESILHHGSEDDEEERQELATVLQPPRHDVFWANFFLIVFAAQFACSFLVYIHTDEPPKNPLGDTIYTILHKSFKLLAVDTVVAIFVAVLWLALLRSHLRPLTYLTIYAFPVILFSFTLWPFITSFNDRWKGPQDKVMRVFSVIPLLGAVVWTYMAITTRHSSEHAIKILELAGKVLSASPALFLSGFTSLVVTVAWFWVWLLMFTQMFVSTSPWWLAVYFVLTLLWTQMVIAGIQRATSGATVSQWYFYRAGQTTAPTNSSGEIVLAAFNHATGPLFGSVCLSSFVTLLVRLPLYVLPRRLTSFFSVCLYPVTPTPLLSLTDPLTLTYSAIHSVPLASAARSAAALPLSSAAKGDDPRRPLPEAARRAAALEAYRTTHMLLHATRQIMTLALGLGAWLNTQRVGSSSATAVPTMGSAYAYVVGLGAALVGWCVLGAVEAIVGDVVDGVVVCWASEVVAERRGRPFCVEAGVLFGSEPEGTVWRSGV